MKDKYIVYNLSIHMTESSCARGVRSVYSDNCKLRPRAPTNYCEVSQYKFGEEKISVLSLSGHGPLFSEKFR